MMVCPERASWPRGALAIIADHEIPGVSEDFAAFGAVTGIQAQEFSPATLAGADVLLVRSVTRVDQALLGAHRPRFLGSATSGVDHVDQSWLADAAIPFAHAPGCNARAVAEYVLSCLSVAARLRGRALATLRVGIVGCGHVGSCLYALLRGLGVDCLVNDPPLRRRCTPCPPAGLPAARTDLSRADFLPLSELCQADVVTLHVPLTRAGEAPTAGLLGADFLGAARADLILINTARGAVVDEQALLHFLHAHPQAEAMIDVWQDEPHINTDLLARARIATPHIAGYSRAARRRASRILSRALARQLGWPLAPEPPEPGPAPRMIREDQILSHYDVRRDSACLRAIQSHPRPAQCFHALRRDYVLRPEFSTAPLPDGMAQAV